MAFTFTQVTKTSLNETALIKAVTDSITSFKESMEIPNELRTDEDRIDWVVNAGKSYASFDPEHPELSTEADYHRCLLEVTHDTEPLTYFVGGRLSEKDSTWSYGDDGSHFNRFTITFLAYPNNASGSKAWVHTKVNTEIRPAFHSWLRQQGILDAEIQFTLRDTKMKRYIGSNFEGDGTPDTGLRDEKNFTKQSGRETTERTNKYKISAE